MNADRWALPLALVLLVGLWPASATAQSLDDQAEEALAKGRQVTGDAAADPEQAAANASNATWHGQQANWTQAWTCTTAYAVDEQAGEAADRVLGCPSPTSERAGEEEEETEDEQDNGSTARAEEAEADAEQAARDQAAATEVFVEDVREEPQQTPSHLETFLERTFAFANRTVAIVEEILALPVDGLRLAGQGFAKVATGATTGIQHAADGARASLAGLQAGAEAVREAGEMGVAATVSGLGSSFEAVAEGTQAAGSTLATGVQAGWQHVADTLGFDADRTPASSDARDTTPSVNERVDVGGGVDVALPGDPT